MFQNVIAGFCSETKEDHEETLSIMQWAEYDSAYMFKYSERPNTYAERNFEDDIPEAEKGRRLQEIINLQNKTSLKSNKKDVGKVFEVLGSKMKTEESEDQLSGLGFSTTQRNSVFCKITGSFARTIEIVF